MENNKESQKSPGRGDNQQKSLESSDMGVSEKSLNLMDQASPVTATETGPRPAGWAATSPQKEPKQSLSAIIQHEEQEAARQEAERRAAEEHSDALLSEREQEEQLMILAMERSLADVNAPPAVDPVAEAAQEEEMMRLAMELSMSEIGNQSFSLKSEPAPVTSRPVAHNHQSYSENYASATALDFAQKVQAESETTEGFVESPHLTKASSKRFLVQPAGLGGLRSRTARQSSERSTGTSPQRQPHIGSNEASLGPDLSEAAKHLSSSELDQIAKALRESEDSAVTAVDVALGSKSPGGSPRFVNQSPSRGSDGSGPRVLTLKPSPVAALPDGIPSAAFAAASHASLAQDHITAEDSAEIERALREADEEEERKSVLLALQIVEEDNMNQKRAATQRQPQGNVRTMTRAEFARVGAFHTNSPPRTRHPLEEEEEESTEHVSSGFRMNANNPQQWVRRDQNSIVGPNNEIRTKHDTSAQGLANAHRLGLNTEDEVIVGNKAYNSFMSSVRRTNKGVATHGTGRAGSDVDTTKGGAMDPSVRLQISRAVNNGLIEKCNGVVKEGKEAIIYHANQGSESGGFDVAVKVFKRIQEFRSRGDYVDGDPRYARSSFRNAGSREQLSLWAEKEMRNLIRANRAGVPVPTPLLAKENIIFMRFLGTDGWPAPQLREVNLRRGSKRWMTLYTQVIEAMKKLYQGARLVHGDLSEYNILIAPAPLVENSNVGVAVDELQAVFIDFGQSVDVRHPEALELLERDMDRVQTYFKKVGVDVMPKGDALGLVIGSEFPYTGASNAIERLNWTDSK